MPTTSPLEFSVDRKSRLKLKEQLQILAMEPREQRKVIMTMARAVRKQAATNIRQQRTVEGRSMAPRKDARVKRRMLTKLARPNKRRGLQVYGRGNAAAELTYGNKLTGQIAYRHQHGIAEPWTSARASKVYGTPDYGAPATRAQAKALNAAGYRVSVKKKRGKGSRLKRVSIKWICENLTQGQAGSILKILNGGKQGQSRWETKPAARSFLGATPEQAEGMLQDLARRTIEQLKK